VGNVIFAALCILVFAAGLSSFWHPAINGTVISGYEIAFLLVYATLSRMSPARAEAPKVNPIIMIAIAAWLVSVTISLFSSPYDMVRASPGFLRYEQTLSHVVFFIAVREFLCRHRVPVQWALLAIPTSSLVMALAAAYLLRGLDQIDAHTAGMWFNNPPFHTHIRHAGYQVAAGVAVLIAFLAAEKRAPLGRAAMLLTLITLCTFLIWMGGRGSILSVIASAMLLFGALRLKGVRCKDLSIFFPLSIAVALALSQWLAVFPWNGVIDLTVRTTDAIAAQDFNQVGSGRVAVWRTSWETTQEHLLFGLGPNGYWFMPNHIYGAQPHSFLIQFLVEWGLVGSLLFLALLAYAFFRGLLAHVIRMGKEMDIAALSAGTMIATLTLHGLVDGTYYHPQPSFYLALGLAIWTLPSRSEARLRA
jgi:O-antigen ligase